MRRVVSFLFLVALAGAVSAGAPAEPRSQRAVVTAVRAADALVVRLASGKVVGVRVAGVRAPAAGACFAGEATAGTRQLALGRRVALVRDGAGYSVSLPGGADLGLALVAGGFAQVDAWGPIVSRFPAYVAAQQRAERANQGVWGACAADVAVAIAAAPNPVAVGGRVTYTVTVSNRGPLTAAGAGLELRPPDGVELVSADSAGGSCTARDWVGTCRLGPLPAGSVAVATFVAEIRRAGTISTRAAIHLEACIRAACGDAPLHDPNLRNDETAALSTAVDGTPSPPSPPGPGPGSPPPPPSAGGCHPSYPSVCIPPPPPDLDCADIPYRDFAAPLNVPDPDPHDLDGDEDGVGCQFNDY